MATVSGSMGKQLVDQLIANHGCYPGDPPVQQIIEYKSIEGATCWALCYVEQDIINAYESPYVIEPKVIFKRGVTK